MMKVGSSTEFFTQHFGSVESVRRLAEAGFEALDMGLFHLYPLAHQSAASREAALASLPSVYEEVAAACKEHGIVVNQVHAPFPSYIGNPTVDDALLSLIQVSIAICAQVGSRYLVVHPSWESDRIYDDAIETTFDLNIQRYSALIDDLKKYQVRCCIENMWDCDPVTRKIIPTVCSHPEEMCRMIDTLNDIAGEECFVACLDIGHANLTGDTPERMIRILGQRLAVLHVHDTRPGEDTHTAPFIGEINWERVCRALKAAGYHGVFSFEADTWYVTFGESLAMDSARMLSAIGHDLVSRYQL